MMVDHPAAPAQANSPLPRSNTRNCDNDQACCLWCSTPFLRKTVGAHQKEHCSPNCKNSYNSALRRFGRAMVDEGKVTVAYLKTL